MERLRSVEFSTTRRASRESSTRQTRDIALRTLEKAHPRRWCAFITRAIPGQAGWNEIEEEAKRGERKSARIEEKGRKLRKEKRNGYVLSLAVRRWWSLRWWSWRIFFRSRNRPRVSLSLFRSLKTPPTTYISARDPRESSRRKASFRRWWRTSAKLVGWARETRWFLTSKYKLLDRKVDCEKCPSLGFGTFSTCIIRGRGGYCRARARATSLTCRARERFKSTSLVMRYILSLLMLQ